MGCGTCAARNGTWLTSGSVVLATDAKAAAVAELRRCGCREFVSAFVGNRQSILIALPHAMIKVAMRKGGHIARCIPFVRRSERMGSYNSRNTEPLANRAFHDVGFRLVCRHTAQRPAVWSFFKR